MLNNIYFRSRYLMRLMITNMDLNSFEIVDALINVFTENKYLQQLDFSSTNLKPKYLYLMTNQIKKYKGQYRELNFSYNYLLNDDLNIQDTTLFFENIREIMEQSKILNHINLSGMNI